MPYVTIRSMMSGEKLFEKPHDIWTKSLEAVVLPHSSKLDTFKLAMHILIAARLAVPEEIVILYWHKLTDTQWDCRVLCLAKQVEPLRRTRLLSTDRPFCHFCQLPCDYATTRRQCRWNCVRCEPYSFVQCLQSADRWWTCVS